MTNSPQPSMLNSNYNRYQERVPGITEALSSFARERMLGSFMKEFSPSASSKIVDVGVTGDQRSDSNFFEKSYVNPENITAVGLEDASFLETDFPGLKFVQADALNLPFKDKEFDFAVSWAVIEHVGSRARQAKFLEELVRVSQRAFITTPNRWYPIEFHTVTPFLHWLPPETFRSIIKKLGMDFFATEEHLNLLAEKDILAMLPANTKVTKMHFRLFGPISHLVFGLEPQK